jgi:hypothetical protein
MDDVFQTATEVEILRKADGELLREWDISQEGTGKDTRITTTLLEKIPTGYHYSLKMEDAQKKIHSHKEKKHTLTQKIMLDSESALIPLIQSGSWTTPFRFHLLNGEKGTLHEFEARPQASEKFLVAGVLTECLGVEVLSLENGGKSYLYFRPDGLLTRIFNGETHILYCTSEEIQKEIVDFQEGNISADALPSLETAIHTPDIPGAFNLNTLTVELSIQKRPRVELPPFASNHYQELLSKEDVVAGKAKYVLKLKAYDKPITAPFPYTPEILEKFKEDLEATPLMQVQDPLVQETAKRIVQGTSSAREAAQKIATYVYTFLNKGDSGVLGQYSAVEILQNAYGDCSEHALLFVALCRAAGIPAKRVSGMVCLGNLWGPHAWGEIWVGDWIGADPTTNDIGNVARYIFFGYPDDPYSQAGVVSQGFMGYTRIKLLSASFEEGGEEINLQKRTEHYGVRDSYTFNYLAGVALLKKESDWTLSASLNGLGLRSEKITVQIQVSPDQGARDLESGYGYWVQGKKSYPVLQGYPSKLGEIENETQSTKTLYIPADRRSIFIRIRAYGTLEEREKTFAQFLEALELNAWKGGTALKKEPWLSVLNPAPSSTTPELGEESTEPKKGENSTKEEKSKEQE